MRGARFRSFSPSSQRLKHEGISPGSDQEHHPHRARRLGKTSFLRGRLLAQPPPELGKVEEGEPSRLHHRTTTPVSINSALISNEWHGHKVNLMDTPGYTASRRLRRVSGCIIYGPDLPLARWRERRSTEIVWRYTRNSGYHPCSSPPNSTMNADFDRVVAFPRKVLPTRHTGTISRSGRCGPDPS